MLDGVINAVVQNFYVQTTVVVKRNLYEFLFNKRRWLASIYFTLPVFVGSEPVKRSKNKVTELADRSVIGSK